MSARSPGPRAIVRLFRPGAIPERLIVLGFATAMVAAACGRIGSSLGHMLWVDELYTTTLIGVPALARVWDGALRGVDGNPPLYLTLAWILSHAAPLTSVAPERVLRAFNLVLLAGSALLLHRVGRRVAPPIAAAAGLAALCAADDMPAFVLVEIRTYALYLFLVTATLSTTLDAVDRPTPRRALALAALGVLTALSHSFGGFYALVTVGSGALACRFAGDRRGAATLGAATLPTISVLIAWIAISFPVQSAMASPYGWIPRTGALVLSAGLTGSPALTPVGAAGALAAAARSWKAHRRPFGPFGAGAPGRPSTAALYAALAGYATITVAAAVASQFVTPFFVPRYFAPNLLVAAVFFMRVAGLLCRGLRPKVAAAAVLACVLLGFSAVAQDPSDGDGLVPCVDAGGRFLEDGVPLHGLPVIAESPHAWLPRARYAPERTTLYPLDWRVVLDQPTRARNNATDFHIMDALHRWAGPDSPLSRDVATTDEILARHGSFFVLDEASRGWLDELRSRRRVATTVIGQGAGCRFLRVDLRDAGDR